MSRGSREERGLLGFFSFFFPLLFCLLLLTCSLQGSTDDVLRSGRDMTVGGYALYGSTTMLVLTLGKGVYHYLLHSPLSPSSSPHAMLCFLPFNMISISILHLN